MSGEPKIEELYAKVQGTQPAGPAAIGRGFPVRGFLTWWFREMPGMARWAREHGLIEFSFLRLHPRLSPDFRTRLASLLTTWLVPAGPFVGKILAEGWKWRALPVRDYNLVVYLADFQRKALALIESSGFSRAEFRRMTEAFFRLVYHAGQTGALVSVFPRVFTDNAEQALRVAKGLECFFAADCTRPSFRDLILAHAMVGSRRCLSWGDLLLPNLNLRIPDRFYQCSLPVFEAIVGHLRLIRKELATLKREREDIEWVTERVRRPPGEVPGSLARFYSDLGRNWHADSGDVFLLLLTLVGGMVSRLRELCADQWQVMTQGEKIVSIRLLEDATLAAEVEKAAVHLETAAARQQMMAPEEVSLFRYLDAPDVDLLMKTENQRFVNGRLHAALTQLYELALSLQRIVSGRAPGYAAEFYLTRMVVGKPRWRGRPLAEVFAFTIDAALQAASYFRVKKLQRDLARLEQIERGIAAREREKATLDGTGLIGRYLEADPVAPTAQAAARGS
jgi:hypothetical protein